MRIVPAALSEEGLGHVEEPDVPGERPEEREDVAHPLVERLPGGCVTGAVVGADRVMEPPSQLAEVHIGQWIEARRIHPPPEVARPRHVPAHVKRAIGGDDMDEPGGDKSEEPAQRHGAIDEGIGDLLLVRRDADVPQQHQFRNHPVRSWTGRGGRAHGSLKGSLIGQKCQPQLRSCVEQGITQRDLEGVPAGATRPLDLIEPSDEPRGNVSDDCAISLCHGGRGAPIHEQPLSPDRGPRSAAGPCTEREPVDILPAQYVGDSVRQIAVTPGDGEVAFDRITHRRDVGDHRS